MDQCLLVRVAGLSALGCGYLAHPAPLVANAYKVYKLLEM